MNNVKLPDIHEYSAGWRVVNGPPGFGPSQLGIRALVYEYLGGSGLGIHHQLVWFDVGLGMRLPRKAWDKTRTLHACVWCVMCE